MCLHTAGEAAVREGQESVPADQAVWETHYHPEGLCREERYAWLIVSRHPFCLSLFGHDWRAFDPLSAVRQSTDEGNKGWVLGGPVTWNYVILFCPTFSTEH